jgi:hypothetical protein
MPEDDSAHTTWDQITMLFEAARPRPADEREAWVRAAAADEQTLSEVLCVWAWRGRPRRPIVGLLSTLQAAGEPGPL